MARMIPLTRGFRAVVDDDDYEWLCKWKWHVMPNGRGFYACRRQKMSETGLPKHLTRIVWMHKQIDPNCKDHRDRNGLNNQRENLRPASKSQNAANAEKHSDNSTRACINAEADGRRRFAALASGSIWVSSLADMTLP